MITRTDISQATVLSSLIYNDGMPIIAGLEVVKAITDEKTDTHGAVLADVTNKRLYIVFRGTKGATDIKTDLECIQKKTSVAGKECRVHEGFLKAYESVESQINAIPFNEYVGYQIVVCGHSLGGALATLCGASLPVDNNIVVITFGSPRVGNDKLVKAFQDKVVQSYRFVHHNDPVPMVPKINYRHVDTEVRLDDNGNEISYFSVWKRLLYWIKGKGKFNIALFCVEDHFMLKYSKTVSAWNDKG